MLSTGEKGSNHGQKSILYDPEMILFCLPHTFCINHASSRTVNANLYTRSGSDQNRRFLPAYAKVFLQAQELLLENYWDKACLTKQKHMAEKFATFLSV